MLRRFVWACCLLSLTAAMSAAGAQDAVRPSTRMAPTLREAPQMSLFTGRAAAAPACTASEKTCRIGNYITWCCRADQSCDYAYPGACK